MSSNSACIRLGLIMCVAISSVAAMLIGHASGQANLVRVVSPANFVLQPSNGENGGVRLEFEYGSQVSYVTIGTVIPTDAPLMKLPATAKTMSWTPCNAGGAENPNDIVMFYSAYNSAGGALGGGTWHFKMGPDTTLPLVHITSPANMTVVRPGEALDIVVAGEESKTAKTWQTGLRRLALTDPQKTQTSPETPSKICGNTQWRSEHHFRYVVPRDAEPGLIRLTAMAEDWAKNTGEASLDLVVTGEGYTGLWTTKGSFKEANAEMTYTIEASFNFTFNRYTGAVQCGSGLVGPLEPGAVAKPYCGSASVTFDPGWTRGQEGRCVWTRTPSFSVFKISVAGRRKGNEVIGLSIQPTERPAVGSRFDCPAPYGRLDSGGGMEAPVGSMYPEGITIAIPVRDHTTATKDESSGPTAATHKVELYPPRQNR
jgi:hypothetical protein